MGVYVPVYVNVYVYPPVDVVGSGGWGGNPHSIWGGGCSEHETGDHSYIYIHPIFQLPS